MIVPPLCNNNSIDGCDLLFKTALPPTAILLALLFASLPLGIGKTWVGRQFTPFLTLAEAEHLLGASIAEPALKINKHSTSSIVLTTLASFQLVAWLAVLVIEAVHLNSDLWPALALTVVWAYTAARLALRPRPTPQFQLLFVFLAHTAGALVRLGYPLYLHYSYPEDVGLPQRRDILAMSLDLFVVVLLVATTMSRPLNIPSANVDVTKIGVKVSPEDYTSLWQWLNFGWVYPIIAKGAKDALTDTDVWDMSPMITTKAVFLKFTQLKKSSSLVKRIWNAHSRDMLTQFGLVYLGIGLEYSQPVFLKKILETINGDGSSSARSLAVVYALFMFFASICRTECDLQHLWFSRRVAGQLRCELMSAIYEKTLKRKDLSGATNETEKEEEEAEEGNSDEETTHGADIGKIVNLMSNDAERLSDAATSIFQIISAPVEIIIACALLYRLLGWSAFAGFSAFIVVIPINYWLTKRGVKISEKRMSATDARMSTLNELITEAKFIKFFAWEGKWIDRTLAARKKELAWVVKERIVDTLFYVMWDIVPNIVSVTSFIVYIYSGHSLTVPVAFTAIALFQMLQHPLDVIPYFISRMLQLNVSVRRIQGFLEEEEVPDYFSSLKRNVAAPAAADTVLGIENACFTHSNANRKKEKEKKPDKQWFWKRWFGEKEAHKDAETPAPAEEEETPFELRDIDIEFPTGALTLITGPTASGKSSLLRALLGEMTMISTTGKILIPKSGESAGADGLTYSVSYAAQTPWLQQAAIKENIVYGALLDEKRYDAVVEACELKPDFRIFEDGDSTEIGARGISLSGGQKARVALARAVYQHTKVLLLDDPLSAVDSHTARRLLDKLFRGPLLANRTVVLVTHHVELMLPAASHIVRLLDGRVDAFGTVAELRAKGLLDEIKHEAELEQKHDAPPQEDAKAVVADDKKAKKLVEEEARAVGAVEWRIYKTYLKAAAYITWVAIIILILVSQGFHVGQLLWIRIWGEASSEVPTQPSHAGVSSKSFFVQSVPPTTVQHPFDMLHVESYKTFNGGVSETVRVLATWPNADEHPLYYVGIYAAISIGSAITGLLINIIEYIGAYHASKSLFKRLLVSVVRAPFRWFDTVPSGRILNRFSRDIEVIDNSLSSSFGICLNEFMTFLAGVVTIAYVLPAFLFPAAFIAYLYYFLAVGYLNTSRSLRRMEANSRSPVFDSFNELLSGIVTVRAFSSEHRFLEKFYSLTDAMNRSWWSFWMLNRYLLFRFDIIGAFTILATALLGLFSMGSSDNFAGWAGITITSSMSICMSVYWTARFYTQLELDLNSIERVVEYLDIAQEPPAVIESNRPPAYWPSSTGGPEKPLLQVEDLTVKYAPDLPAVLHGISFSLKANERVGLLGRTGSGKSTIAMSLLRFVDPAGGKIIVDGIDITTIGLQDLRSNITFIPQDASLFSGNVRDNLDPFGDYTDEECAEVLTRVHLVTNPASAFNTLKSSAVPSATTSGAATPNAETRSISTATRTDDERTKVTLTTKVSPGGSNFSQGQRQLISLARALLRRSNIIIMDEATSSIDFETDAKIQATIREEFKNSLLLTVAHRLKTIADYDRLIVLDQGNIVEFDTPANLIRKEGGLFRDMALKSGIFSELETIALSTDKPSS